MMTMVCKQVDQCHIHDAECHYQDGEFVFRVVPSCLPSLFTIRFTAPANYTSGDSFVIKGFSHSVLTTAMNQAATGAFTAGAVVTVEIDFDRKMAFLCHGRGGAADITVNGYVTEFRSFYEQTAPKGWMARDGRLVENASVVIPDLYDALQQPENAWKCVTEAEWQQMVANFPPDEFATNKGVGGAPYFVLDVQANTIRLPDTRGMYLEDAGFDGLTVGGVHGDAIRNIHGTFATNYVEGAYSGAIYSYSTIYGHHSADNNQDLLVRFSSDRVVPTANKNQPRAFGVLGCVFVGTITN